MSVGDTLNQIGILFPRIMYPGGRIFPRIYIVSWGEGGGGGGPLYPRISARGGKRLGGHNLLQHRRYEITVSQDKCFGVALMTKVYVGNRWGGS